MGIRILENQSLWQHSISFILAIYSGRDKSHKLQKILEILHNLKATIFLNKDLSMKKWEPS